MFMIENLLITKNGTQFGTELNWTGMKYRHCSISGLHPRDLFVVVENVFFSSLSCLPPQSCDPLICDVSESKIPH